MQKCSCNHFKYWLIIKLFIFITIIVLIWNKNKVEGFEPAKQFGSIVSSIYRPQIRNARIIVANITTMPDTFKNRVKKMLR